ncbi:MAG TPA: hypothetical protein PKU89_02170 [Kiritimatiellia bacterium]|nr:hypothetical protein [Kiritimatiellia bacterium]
MNITSMSTRLKPLWRGLFAAVLLAGLAGCIGDDDDEVYDLSFENLSSHTVTVVSLNSEWGGFTLAPGESITLRDIQNIDYYYVPSSRVQEGSDSTEREVVFVNAPPSGL